MTSLAVRRPVNILLSIDYEVFWVDNDDECEVLVKPTEHLLRHAEELGVRYTLFVDVLCLSRYRDHGDRRFVDAVEQQLRDAIRRGHDVQTHLHPHWLFASRKDKEGRWSFPNDRFLLGQLGDPEHVYARTRGLLEDAQAYLEGLLRPVRDDYRTVAYRAGGYGLQPNENAVLRALLDSGYRIDSSVVPGMFYQTGRNCIDFRNVPDRANWIIGPENGLEGESRKGLMEVPIAATRIGFAPFLAKVADYATRRLRNDRRGLYGQGSSRDPSIGRRAEIGTPLQSIKRKLRILTNRWANLSTPGVPAPALIDVARRWVASHAEERPLAFSFLLHSKGLSPIMLADLAKFVHGVRDAFGEDLAFPTFRELAGSVPQAEDVRLDLRAPPS